MKSLVPQTQPSTKSKTKVSFFQTLVQNNVKWVQKRKTIALSTHVHLRTAHLHI